MSNEANVDMVYYIDLQTKERDILKAIEGEVVNLILKNGVVERPVWTSKIDSNGRFIQLCMPDNLQPKILFELEEGKFANLTRDELIAQLHRTVK